MYADCCLVTLFDLDDLVGVEATDAVMVAHKDKAHDAN